MAHIEKMTKPEAVAVIFHNCKIQRQPKSPEFRRLVRALAVLGLSPLEMMDACRELDIVNRGGVPIRPDLIPLAPWMAK